MTQASTKSLNRSDCVENMDIETNKLIANVNLKDI